MAATMKTRVLILSDTHNEYDDLQELPHADVLLHCGDLTQVGGLSNYKKAIETMKRSDAELKLVIAGNHDISLDPAWWKENLIEDEDDPEECTKALELFRGADARSAGIHYLEEGTNTFTLKSGATFSVFASQYTPEFGGWAFPYAQDDDRWTKIPENVDIVMTHGPPRFDYAMDLNLKGEPCGCPLLAAAVTRVKPLLHCFGHIHEGRGVQRAHWTADETKSHVEFSNICSIDDSIDVSGKSTTNAPIKTGSETLFINAAIETHGDTPNNSPWLLDLDLPLN